MRKRKLLSVLMAACVMAGSLTGCGGSSDNASTNGVTEAATQEAEAKISERTDSTTSSSGNIANGDVTELTFWYSWTGNIQENNIELTELFNETVGKEKGIHVTAEYQGTYDELHQKLQAAYVANQTPEITVMEIGSIRTFAENGVLEPLDSYITESNVDMDDFYEGLMPNCYVNDVCYGLPYLRSTPIMYCNNTLLKEAGWDCADIKTWDDLKAAATAVHEKTGKYGMTQYSYIWTLEAFLMEHGTTILNEDETATNINTAEAKEVINYYKDMVDAGIMHAYTKAEGSDKLNTDIQNQSCAIWFGSTGDLTSKLEQAEEGGWELGTAFIPMEAQYGTPTGGCCLIMTSNVADEKKAAAWEFLNWMTQTEQTVKASMKTGYLVSRKSAGESEEMQAYFKEVPQAQVALQQLEYASGRPTNPNYTEAIVEIEQALDTLWVNGGDVDQTLEALEEKVNKILNQ